MEHLAHEPPCCYLCAISVLSICYLMLSLCYLMLSLCYLYAISVLSMLSCSRTAFFVRAISVLSLCYLCYLMLGDTFSSVLSRCYLCAIYAISCYLCAISVLSLCYLSYFSLKAMYVYYMNVGRNGFHLLMYLYSISKKGNTMNY